MAMIYALDLRRDKLVTLPQLIVERSLKMKGFSSLKERNAELRADIVCVKCHTPVLPYGKDRTRGWDFSAVQAHLNQGHPRGSMGFIHEGKRTQEKGRFLDCPFYKPLDPRFLNLKKQEYSPQEKEEVRRLLERPAILSMNKTIIRKLHVTATRAPMDDAVWGYYWDRSKEFLHHALFKKMPWLMSYAIMGSEPYFTVERGRSQGKRVFYKGIGRQDALFLKARREEAVEQIPFALQLFYKEKGRSTIRPFSSSQFILGEKEAYIFGEGKKRPTWGELRAVCRTAKKQKIPRLWQSGIQKKQMPLPCL